jgi:5-formyltetrahydrofolate cyclo-ligase
VADRIDDKAALRKRMKLVRDMVDDRLMRSVDLWSQLAASHAYQRANTVMAFNGFKSEPDTDPLFARIAADGKRLVLPRIEDGDIVVVDGSGPMATSRIGVTEPQGPPLPIDLVDLVIVPGLAFTLDGYRLGYGGGFYDRFLPKCRQLAVPDVGVCFLEQVVDELPTEPHDVRVQLVITA